jgi:rSAM/selenodomain-associated transferase 2
MDTPVRNMATAEARDEGGIAALTIVIPVLNADTTLQATLNSVAGRDLVVVDGGSQDDTAAFATAAGARVVVGQPGRGGQLKAGAIAATGSWLLFLHGDTCLGPGWQAEVAAFIEDPASRDRAAVFRFRLDDAGWRARVMARGVALRARLLGLPYGDQGLLICRAFYDRLGGYRLLPLMEDVDLVRRVGRARLVFFETEAVTSAARYRRDGYTIRAGRNLICLMLFLVGARVSLIRWVYEA